MKKPNMVMARVCVLSAALAHAATVSAYKLGGDVPMCWQNKAEVDCPTGFDITFDAGKEVPGGR